MHITFFTDPRRLITLPTGDYDTYYSHLNYIIQLIRAFFNCVLKVPFNCVGVSVRNG